MSNSQNSLPDLNNCVIAILGLGYVGLPLAVSFSKTKNCFVTNQKLERKVVGFDINNKRINELKNGFDRTNEIPDKKLLCQQNLLFTNNLEDIFEADVFIITVPTPIDKFKKPDLSSLKKVSKLVGSVIKLGMNKKCPIILYESTVYPGATEEVCVPIIESESKLKLNRDFFVGYSPERINPGDKEHRLELITKVTSGSNLNAASWIDSFYSSIIKAGTYKASSIKVAEAAKVIENTQRDLNIALINELAFIFNKLGISTFEVLKAACTKWNFLDFKPGLVGGHCIGIDPYYLTYKAKSLGYYPKVVLAGREINDSVSKWVVEQMVINLAKKKIPIGGTDALILGFSFKENCNDCRNTKVKDIIENMHSYGINPVIVDPVVDKEEAFNEYEIKILDKIPNDKKFNAIIIAVAHNQFKLLEKSDWERIKSSNSVIIDIKNILPKKIEAIRF